VRRSAQETVEVTYSAADIGILNLAIWRFWANLVAGFAAVVILMPVIFALFDGYSVADAAFAIDWTFTAWIVVILVIWTLVLTLLVYAVQRWRGLHGPIQFGLSEEGVTFRNRQMDGLVFWTTIKSIKVRGGRLFLFITRRSALILPRRVFHSDADFETFVAAAREHWQRQH
jgi:hypothetical protein